MINSTHPSLHFMFCPKCGVKGKLNEQSLSFKCAQCGFNYFLNASAAVSGIIINSKNEVLFTRRAVEPAIGKLDFPGGFVDPGEDAITALFREIKEELNLTPRFIEFIGSYANQYLFSGVTVDTCDMVFICKDCNLNDLQVADDVSSVEFISLNDIIDSELSFNVIGEIINDLKNSVFSE